MERLAVLAARWGVMTVGLEDRSVDAGRSFNELFVAEQRAMVRLAFLMTGSAKAAEEVAQEAFATVYERWTRIDNHGGYLRKCVVHGSMRYRSRTSGRELFGRDLEATVSVASEPESEFDHTLMAIEALRPRARALVVLRFYCDCSLVEIAALLRVPVGTVKSGLHRALADLRELLS